MKIVLIYSGGLDSAVLLYKLRHDGHEVVTVGFDYGQRNPIELEHAQKLAAHVGVEYQVVDLKSLQSLLASSLTTPGTEVPDGHYTEDKMKAMVVPNRNGIMLSIAIGYAITLEAEAVAFGAQSGGNTVYPDSRPAFVQAMDRVGQVCDWTKVQVLAPFADWSKAGIVKFGDLLGVPFELTWSCYKGRDEHCGKCAACVGRKEAFKVAGVADPTVYEE